MNAPLDSRLDRFLDLEPELEDFRTAILAGLSRPRKSTPAKFFYDAEGSRLFERICELPEYYPTRTECRILRDQAAEIGADLPSGATVLEFGSGSAEKIGLLLEALDRPRAYMPLDISRDHLLASADAFAADHPELEVIAICADFTEPLNLDGIAPEGPRIGFFPGSTIGNLEEAEAARFLEGAARTLGPGGHFVIGVDLVKDPMVLEAAYDDAQGVTAAFNLNLLARINRELDGDFDLEAFRHVAIWNPELWRIEMHLMSLREQTVHVADQPFHFRVGETIHTENSHKYTVDGFARMAACAGFETRRCLTDPDNLFSVHVLKVV
ncbi:MAG: L-histidine N(alpha)-methyltransferase [Minwuia sp.]|uniref:L-histidine N(alpha)-methyltransferase n=1 Tax=Minwuia sp. TaxID=2493630 RepID=UPI003A84255F